MVCCATIIDMEKTVEKKKIGLLFGSFNPVHKGHVALAKKTLAENLVDEVWFVVSPQNPQKDKKILAPFEDRFQMTKFAIGKNENILVSDIEKDMDVPSYTFHTLRVLREKYPNIVFSIIAGADVLESVMTWKEPEEIISHHDFIVRHRIDGKDDIHIPPGVRVTFLDGILELSSTEVRNGLREQEEIHNSIDPEVIAYIKEKGLYK